MLCSQGRTTGGSKATTTRVGEVVSIFGCDIIRDIRGSCGGGGFGGWAKTEKIQIPTSKFQRSHKLQIPKRFMRRKKFGTWGLRFLREWERGIWSFTSLPGGAGTIAWLRFRAKPHGQTT